MAGAVSAATATGAAPTAATLAAVYPNPARGALSVRYGVPSSGPTSGHVRLALYDVLGREVAVLHNGPAPSGWHAARVDAPLAAGLYVLRLTAAGASAVRTVTVLR